MKRVTLYWGHTRCLKDGGEQDAGNSPLSPCCCIPYRPSKPYNHPKVLVNKIFTVLIPINIRVNGSATLEWADPGNFLL